jgi:multidrug efflux pump subunit AcrA (membrane-fusion protein)
MAAALAALAACSKAPETRPEEIRPVRVMKIGGAGDAAARRVEYPGEVRPRYETRLAFRVGGKIVARHVEVATRVRQGQVLAGSIRRI